MERVGLIKAGMTLDEVEKIIGPSKDPTFGSGKQRREYPKLGLTIKLVSDGFKKVESVQCGSLDPNDNLVKSKRIGQDLLQRKLFITTRWESVFSSQAAKSTKSLSFFKKTAHGRSKLKAESIQT